MIDALRSLRAPVVLSLAVVAAGCGKLPGLPGADRQAGEPRAQPVAPGAQAAPGGARARLLESILCVSTDGPLQAVRELARDPATARAEGVGVNDNGLAGADEVIELTLEPAMVLPFGNGGARVGRLVLAFDSPHEGFGAVVYAEVEGEARDAILELGLQPREDHPAAIAPWFRLGHPPDPDAVEPDICPAMVGLKETGPGRYLLGCGWCNG